ncbi:MAG: ATP-dependent Clp protease adaptor ClpS [Chitinophagales bacterium]|nr:ATP-dependent Clp protease adaptor ClpS [Chitinophagales bacterium]
MSTETLERVKTSDTDTTGAGRVILFNDDWHTFDEVIKQLIRAIKCSIKQAEKFAWTVHETGKCNVYEGPMEECLSVSAILEEINLKTEIEFAD